MLICWMSSNIVSSFWLFYKILYLKKLLQAKKKLIDLVQIDKKSDQTENLIDKCEKKT